MTTPANQTGILCAQIRKAIKRGETYVCYPEEWEKCRMSQGERDTATIDRIAEKAKCDWLYHQQTGETRFFAGN